MLYVSLKYTKTCDVILNLLLRWKLMMEVGIDFILKGAKRKKKISSIPDNSVKKVDEMKKLFKKDKDMIKVLIFYEMLRKISELRKERTGEFRKNVTLKIYYQGEEINVNLEKLKEYAEMLEKFISKVKQNE